MQLLEDISHEQKQARIKAMIAYRTLMIKAHAAGGMLADAKDRKKFVELQVELSLTDDEVRGHFASLERKSRISKNAITQAKLEGEVKALQPSIDSWAKRYEQMRAELDAEGGPLLAQMAELQRRIQSIIMAGVGLETEEERFPEFYRAGEPETVKPPPPTAEELERNRRINAALFVIGGAQQALASGQVKRATITSEIMLDAIATLEAERVFDTTTWAECNRSDPRLDRVLKIAGMLKRGSRKVEDREIVVQRGGSAIAIPTQKELAKSDKALVEIGLKFRWIAPADIDPQAAAEAQGAFGKPVEAAT